MNKYWPDLGSKVIDIIEEKIYDTITNSTNIDPPAPPPSSGELPKL